MPRCPLCKQLVTLQQRANSHFVNMHYLAVVSLLLLMRSLPITDAVHFDNPAFPELVIKITRHGARTPINFLPEDPNNSFWNESAGQLTNLGKNQLYAIGKIFQAEYKGYLSEYYKPEEILVLSTAMDRTIMSAQTFLAALYQPKGYQVWNRHIDWQPIPVHMLDYNVDAMTGIALMAMTANCHQGTEDDLFFNRNKDLIELIQAATGIYYKTCLDMNFLMVLDTFMVEKFYGRTLPFGLDSHYEDIKKLKDDVMVGMFGSPVMASATNGPLNQELSSLLEAKTNNVSTYKAITIFMHDANVLAFLSTITKTKNLTSPAFAASIVIELIKTTKFGEERFIVKAYHIPTPTAHRQVLRIKGCGYTCSLDEFLEQLRIASTPQIATVCPCYQN